MKRAAIYARVSRAYKEDDERITIEAQLADSRAYCQERGYLIVAEFVDKDKYRVRGKLVQPSGTRKDRPGYQALIKAARAGEIDVMIAWKEDRLYRGMYAAIPIAEALDDIKGLAVELVKETFDVKMLGIKAAVAKIELDNIRERMVMGRRYRLERGEVPGGPTRYGYEKAEDNRLVINESEAETVRKIFDWYLEGHNNMEIRRRLTALDIPPRINTIWSKATINNILTFEGYGTGHYETTLDDETFTIQCEPIISLAAWEKALEMRAGNIAYPGRNVKEDYLCRGMVVCLCGWKWTARTCRGKYQHGKSGYYGCAMKDHKPEEVHPDCPGTIGAKKLDTFVWDFIVGICKNPALVQRAIDAKISRLEEESNTIEAEAEELNRQLSHIEEERQWIITMARKGKITADDMDLQLGGMEFQALDLRKKLNDKYSALAMKNQADNLKAWAENYLSDLANGIRALEGDPETMADDQRAALYSALEAGRYEAKYDGDQVAALRWAILEEKREYLRMLIESVLVVKGPNGEKMIIPQLAFEIPCEYASLVYDDQSLAYVEQIRTIVEGD